MQTILNKLLKTPTGKYSRKSFMLVVSFLVTIILGVFLVTADCFLKYKPTDISVGIFNSLLLFVIGQTTAAVADKKIQTKNTREIPQNEE